MANTPARRGDAMRYWRGIEASENWPAVNRDMIKAWWRACEYVLSHHPPTLPAWLTAPKD